MNRLKINEPNKNLGLYVEPNQKLQIDVTKINEGVFIYDYEKEKPFQEVMKLDKTGMTYKGVKVEDAGEAYNIFLEIMNHINIYNKSLNLTQAQGNFQ